MNTLTGEELPVSLVSRRVEELDTPCLVVDLDRMERNIAAMAAAVAAGGARLRPHVKTHKVPAIARMQLAAGAAGITVAKVAEAEVFAAHGLHDIFIAYPVVTPAKAARAAALAAGGCRIIVGVDSLAGARALSAAAAAAGVRLEVRLELDSGMHRCGMAPEGAAELAGQVMALPGLELTGIFTFRSNAFAGAAGRPLAEVGREEGEWMAAEAERLRAAGIPVREVSCGSTPTGRSAAAVPGVTEVRPGTYVFHDYMMAEQGACTYDDVALTIRCTVVSRPAPDLATVDGGSKTFCGDVVPQMLGLAGYARAVGMAAYVERMSEEHGVVRLGPGADPAVGQQVDFIPIHVCTTVNLADELVGVRRGRVEQVWPVLARGKRT